MSKREYPTTRVRSAVRRLRHDSMNRERLVAGDAAARFIAAVLDGARVRRLLSDEHFSVDGTLIAAWASMKSFRSKQGGDDDAPGAGGRNAETRLHALLCCLALPIVPPGSRAAVRRLSPQVRGGRWRSSAARAKGRLHNGFLHPTGGSSRGASPALCRPEAGKGELHPEINVGRLRLRLGGLLVLGLGPETAHAARLARGPALPLPRLPAAPPRRILARVRCSWCPSPSIPWPRSIASEARVT